MELKHFKKGGIHPHDSKYTSDKPITNAHLPKIVRIPMNMHIGAPAKVLVKAGDKVEEGQLIGEAVGFISANIHASVSGTVTAVEKADTLTAKGVEYVIIETGGTIRNWYDRKFDYSKLPGEKLLEMVKTAGIVGMGGATFPTHVKLSPPKEKKMDLFILNGAECEPYLTIDHRLMLEKPDEIVEGIGIVKKILGINKVMIGIEENKLDAIEAMSKASAGDSSIEVYALRTRYPQGGEKQLIEALTGKQVPSGGLPSDIGAVVQNVATVYAIYEAVVYQKPLIERGLTFTGENVENRGNYKVRIGSPVQELIDEFGIPADHGSVIAGGPMMGLLMPDDSVPVRYATSNPGVAVVNAAGLVTAGNDGQALIFVTALANSNIEDTCVVDVSSAPPPLISLNPTSLTFTDTAGTSNPSPQAVAVDNSGGGTDWLLFSDEITAERLSYIQEGDDLIVRVDEDETRQVRVRAGGSRRP